jgi:hypothetical protein
VLSDQTFDKYFAASGTRYTDLVGGGVLHRGLRCGGAEPAGVGCCR